MALRYLDGEVTQSATNTYTENQIQTALSGTNSRAYLVRSIQLDPLQIEPAAATPSEVEIALLRRSKTSMPTLEDNDIILKTSRQNFSNGAGYLKWIDNSPIFNYGSEDEVLIVEDPLFFAISTTNLSGPYPQLKIRIGYELVDISELDRLNLLVESLQ